MGRYTSTFVNPQGVGDKRPTARQIILDEDLENKLVGKVIVITGASSGIGLETARALCATGATLFLTVRDQDKAQEALGDVLEEGSVSLVRMNNESLSSVRAAANTILLSSGNRVNILINNAGIMGLPSLQLTEEGHEKHFATNHLSHFLLFQLLKPALLASATPAFHSRVVMVASSAHRAGDLSDDQKYDMHKGYSHEIAYNNSKLAMIYTANEIDRRYGARKLHGYSLHPGAIFTNIGRHADPELIKGILANEALQHMLLSPEQGAATTVYAAVSAEWEGKGGRYLENCEEANRGEDDGQVFSPGYVRQTYNPAIEKRLWTDSLRLAGINL